MKTIYFIPRGLHRDGAPFRPYVSRPRAPIFAAPVADPVTAWATARDTEPAVVTIERTPGARVVTADPYFRPVSPRPPLPVLHRVLGALERLPDADQPPEVSDEQADRLADLLAESDAWDAANPEAHTLDASDGDVDEATKYGPGEPLPAPVAAVLAELDAHLAAESVAFASGSWAAEIAAQDAPADPVDDEDTPQGDDVDPGEIGTDTRQGDNVEPSPVPEDPDPIAAKVDLINALHDEQDRAEGVDNTDVFTKVMPAVDGDPS